MKKNHSYSFLFFSEDAHYSLVKGSRVLDLTTFYAEGNKYYKGMCPITQHIEGKYKGYWPEDGTPADRFEEGNPHSGQVKLESLKKLVEFFVEKGHPVIIVLNVGSTWRGAYDDVQEVDEMLKKLGKKYPELWDCKLKHEFEDGSESRQQRRRSWAHIDGALGAAYLPYLEMAHAQNKIENKPVKFDFRNKSVMSIGCSLHKWPGLPIPS